MLTFVLGVGYLCFKTNSLGQIGVTAVLATIVLGLVYWEISVHWKPSTSPGGDNLLRRSRTVKKALRLLGLRGFESRPTFDDRVGCGFTES